MSELSHIVDIETESDAWTIERLVREVTSGRFRIPFLQRQLVWDAEDVVELFDSVHRGFPIGSFLLRRARAEAGKADVVELGPLTVEHREIENALWVVDGQQRLVSLAASLARDTPIPTTPDDPYVVYFDASTRTFRPPPQRGSVPSEWVPLPELADSARLNEWVFAWPHGRDDDLRRRTFDASRRIREYRIPLYIVETDDEEVLKTIFDRINRRGKRLTWPQVHKALFGRKGERPSTTAQLADVLAELGMGRPDENLLLQCVLASQGLDVTQSLDAYIESHADTLLHGVSKAEPAVRQAMAFLRDRCEMPHLALVPRPTPSLIILSAFFKAHPSPSPRVATLLTRWVWRMSFGFDMDQRTLLRNGTAAVRTESDEEAVQGLLRLHPRDRGPFEAPSAFSSTAANSRLGMLGLASMRPRDLHTHRPLDVAALIEAADDNPFRRIWKLRGNPLADRAILPGRGAAADDLRRLAESGADDVLRSHAVNSSCQDALMADDREAFVQIRRRQIEAAVREMSARLAAWDHPDRPSISELLSRAS